MTRFMMMVLTAMTLAAMGPGRTADPPVKVNPPTPAEVDAAQRRPAVPEGDAAEAMSSFILDAATTDPDEFLWQSRPIVVFADTVADLAFQIQVAALEASPLGLLERDVVVIFDADPSAGTAWRKKLNPSGFSLVIMDKDGEVKQRKPVPWSVREITRAIDKFPLRREEIGRVGMSR